MTGARQPRKKRAAPSAGEELRKQAEERLDRLSADAASPVPEDVAAVVHDLRVHQIELEMQNEELRHAQLELQASREKFFDLFDLAPVGYLTLSQEGVIHDANLTAARLLGVERQQLVDRPFTTFIFPSDQDVYYLQDRMLERTGEPQVFELRLRRPAGEADGGPAADHFWARLERRLQHGDDGEPSVVWVTFSCEDERLAALEALRESEEKFRATIAQSMDGILIADRDFRIIEWNDAQTAIFGHSKEEMLGTPLWEHQFATVPAEERTPAMLESLRRSMLEFGRSPDSAWMIPLHERVVQTKDGRRRTVQSSFFPISTPSAVLWGAISRDVTERLAAEADLREAEALRRSEELYREMFGGHSVVMFLTDPETGDIVTANQAAVDFFGVPADRLSGMNVRDFSCSARDHLVVERDEALAGSQSVFSDVYRLADGCCRDVEVRVVPIRLRDRTLLYAIVFDVTERKQAENALRDRERQLAEAQRIAHVGSWSWDAATGETTRAEETCRIYGRSLAEIGTDQDIWLECVHPDDRERASEVTARAVAEARPYAADFRVVWPDGSEHVVLDSGEPVLDDNGRVVRMWGYIQDITEQRRAEDELRRRAEELELFNRAMVDREMRIIEMKEIVNALSRQLGAEPPYAEVWRDPEGGGEGAAE